MQAWEWIFFVVVVAVVVVAALIRMLLRKRLTDKVISRESELAAERVRADKLAGDAARLPDALQRLQTAEERASGFEVQLREAAGRESHLAALLEESTTARREASRELTALEGQIADLRTELEAVRLDARTSAAALEASVREVGGLRGRLSVAESSLDQVRTKLGEREIELAQTAADRDAALALVAQSKIYLDNAQATMRTVFVEAASAVFDEKSAVLDRRIKETTDQSKQHLETTLKPFAEQVTGFRNRIEQLTTEQARDNAILQGAVGKLHELNRGMADATDALTKALKGNAKTRGDWGEMILETVLKASGLEEGINFRRQASGKDEETGQRRQPDVVFDLPDGRQVVIDSKVNLIAWADYHATSTPEEAQEALIRHTAALRGHMKDLAEKNYPKVLGGQTMDLTVLFVPIEGALAAALSTDPSLQTDAWAKRITFASPNTLMMMLKVVERLWTRDRLQKQVGVIADEASKLVDSLITFLEDFKKIEDKLKAVSQVYGDARNRLYESNQSVVARAGRLVKAGARGKKALPDELQSGPDILDLPLLVQEET